MRTKRVMITMGITAALLGSAGQTHAADVQICVDVVVQDADGHAGKPPAKPAEASQPKVAPRAIPPTTQPATDVESASPTQAPAATEPPQLSAGPGLASGPPSQPNSIPDAEYPGQRRQSQSPYSGGILPLGQTPEVYLKRLFEYFVSHQPGFRAVKEGCKERIVLELYPLNVGWTAFARYSGTGREERVDQIDPSELSPFAERAVLALLEDVPISSTINRENVLRSDSHRSTQRVRGSNHYVLGVGTQLRSGRFNTAVTSGKQSGTTEQRLRLFFPMTITTGYRGRFESWGFETMALIGIGTSKTASRKNPAGGHIDFGGDAGLALHVLRYKDPRGLTSFYYGAGSTFELSWFSAIRAANKSGDSRSSLVGGGLDVDLLLGWEFMRASAVQFFLQGELNAPAYAIQNADANGSINTWFPGVSLKLGAVF